jgi:nitrate reductase NapAB chaperone NapD
MDNIWLTTAIVVVPLLAGLCLTGVLARRIYNDPAVPNGNLIALGIAALLCVAPTLLNFSVKLSNGTEISVVKEQLQTQTQQIRSDFGAQGGKINGKIEALSRRLDALDKEKGTAVTTSTSPNAGKVVVVLHVEDQKDLATEMQDYLLQAGYSANIVFTDFTELSDANHLASGAVAVVSAENNATLRKEVEDVLKAKFPQQMQNALDSSSTKLVGTSVQVRLF